MLSRVLLLWHLLGATRFLVFIRVDFQSVVAVCYLAAGVVFLVLPDWVSVLFLVFCLFWI